MRILFVSPPDIHAGGFDIDTAKRRRYLNYPPYGMGLIAAVHEQGGHECTIVNLQTEVLSEVQRNSAPYSWEGVMPIHPPDVICLTCMFSQTHKSLMAVSSYLHVLYPNVPQVAGGVHVTNALAQPETQQKFLDDLPYITSFGTGEYKVPLDTIPAWHLMDPRRSSAVGKVGAFYFLRGDPVTATVLSNRGCRGHCTFCSVRNFNGQGVRRRSITAVVDELLLLQNDYGVEHVMWLDDDFLYDRRETLALFNLMVQRGVKVTWDCSNGVIAKSCTEEILSGASASGCIGLILGMESGNSEILKAIKKPGTVRIFLEAAEVLRKFPSILNRAFLMIGFPGETLRQIKDTFDVALQMDLDWYNISPLQALPNTPIYGSANQTDFTDIRFNSGPHSRIARRAEGVRELLSYDFAHAFDDLDRVPTLRELDSIWAYMNYYLNYDRLFRETRKVKLEMQQKYIEHICDVISPDNAFAMHFSKVLSRKLGYKVMDFQNDRLSKALLAPYWEQRFRDFNLLEDAC